MRLGFLYWVVRGARGDCPVRSIRVFAESLQLVCTVVARMPSGIAKYCLRVGGKFLLIKVYSLLTEVKEFKACEPWR